ncbi:unnamed protein product [Amoebophrya sp. A120]|nr:unnamed protein product [Amoebophrya sp. A120]|eukprot:GSA120T00005727001.1
MRAASTSLLVLLHTADTAEASRIALRRAGDFARHDFPLAVRDFNKYGDQHNGEARRGSTSARGHKAFLAAGNINRGQSREEFSLLQEQTRTMHATQYYGDLTVGGQKFSVIFDSGSGHLLIPGPKCESAACLQKNRHVYDLKGSKKGMAIGWTDEPTKSVADDSEDRDVTSISFAAGEVVGNYYRDEVCLGGSESSKSASKKGSGNSKDVKLCGMADFIAMQEESDNPFKDSVWDGVLGLGQDLTENSEFSVLQKVLHHSGETEANASAKEKDGIFSFYLHNYGGEINFGRAAVQDRIKPNAVVTKAPISVDGYWQFDVEDITINGEKTGLCQKYKGGKCQAVVDTGSSLLMAPANMLAQISARLNIDDKCKKAKLPSLGFLVQGRNLELPAEEYLDRTDKDCFIAMMAIGDTGRGPIFVLGYPFLRNFFTSFDFDKKELGFVAAKDVVSESSSDEPRIPLKGSRPT